MSSSLGTVAVLLPRRIYPVNTQFTTYLSFLKGFFKLEQTSWSLCSHSYSGTIPSSFCILLKLIQLWEINQTLSDRSNHGFVHLKSAFLKDAELEHQGAREWTSVYV